MLDLKAEIQSVFAKHEKDFILDEKIAARISGDEGLRRAEELKRQFWLMRVHILENRDSIDEEEAQELKELIANKLAIGSKTAVDGDWWWTPADPNVASFLEQIQRRIEKGTKTKSRIWKMWPKYIWAVLVELAYLAIVVGVLSVGTTRFETIVLAALVMIYNAVTATKVGVGLSFTFLASALQTAYGDIGRGLRLRLPVAPEREAQKRLNEASIGMFIHGISLGIGSLIAIWEIITTIFG